MSLPWIPLILSLSLSALMAAPSSVPATRGAASGLPESYRRFAETGGAGEELLRIARGALLEALGMAAPPRSRPSHATGRPAGPRDEPPPPEWPEGPVGLALCVRVGEKVLGCEGDAEAPDDDLAVAITRLADRLGRDLLERRKRVRERERSRAAVEAAFLADLVPLGDAELRRAGRKGGVDLGTYGLLFDDGRGAAVVMPGEARSLRKAERLAGKRGGPGRSGAAVVVSRFTPLRAGEVGLFTP